jgi:hypothetical protein
MGRALRVLLLVLVAGLAGFALSRLRPIPQSEAYHAFADARTMWKIPNALNVASNIGFFLVGWMGLAFLFRGPSRDPDGPFRPGPHSAFETLRERPAYVIFFAGVFLTAFGSGFYHWRPNSLRLFWDRVPMAIAFTALFATVIAERINVYWSRMLLLPLITVGVASVVMWRVSEDRGAGDLRPYIFVQAFPIIALPLIMMMFPSRYTRGWELLVVILLYATAKALEHFDRVVFEITARQVSGHTLKHLVAALAIWFVLHMLKNRTIAEEKPSFIE